MIFLAGACYEKNDVYSANVEVSSDIHNDSGSLRFSLDDTRSWCMESGDDRDTITLTFPRMYKISGFAIGGNASTLTQSFVKEFKLVSKVYDWDSWNSVFINGSKVC